MYLPIPDMNSRFNISADVCRYLLPILIPASCMRMSTDSDRLPIGESRSTSFCPSMSNSPKTPSRPSRIDKSNTRRRNMNVPHWRSLPQYGPAAIKLTFSCSRSLSVALVAWGKTGKLFGFQDISMLGSPESCIEHHLYFTYP